MHGEVTDPAVDFFDREKAFIERVLKSLMDSVPELRVVLEHITMADAADFVARGPSNLAATITPQHMLFNRNSLFVVNSQTELSCLHQEELSDRLWDGQKQQQGRDRPGKKMLFGR